MRLMELQRTMARAVMQPLTRTERMQRKAPGGGKMSAYASRFIKPNDRLTSFERLEIYNRQYWFRVLSSMMEDFPGLRAVMGERRFEEAAKAYLCGHPSQSFTLRNLGSRLEAWLRKNPEWAGAKQKLALDIVRLEWADIEAFDGKAEEALRPEDLNGDAGPNLQLRLQPYIQLLDMHYPVDDLLLDAKLKSAEIYLVVHRVDYSVYFRRVDREEFLILSALRQGKPLGKAIDIAFRKSSIAPEERASKVQEWFQNWAALGWFCRTEKKSVNH